MNSWNRRPFQATGIPLALALTLAACSGSDEGTMGGKVNTRAYAGNVEAEPQIPRNTTTSPTTDEVEAVVPEKPVEIEPPKIIPPVAETSPKNEGISAPVNVTGAYLFCYREKVEATKATVFCATEDKDTRKAFEPSERYIKHEFTATAPTGLTFTKKDLPAIHRYNVEFQIQAKSPDVLTRELSGMQFFFSAIDSNNNAISEVAKPTNNDRPELWVQSLKPQGSQPLRCLDRYRMVAVLPEVVTTSCSTEHTHTWYVRADGKIAHLSSGECLAFNNGKERTLAVDCGSAQAVEFEFNGEQIKVKNSNQCLGLITPDNSGVDYSASVTCSVNDVTQRWKVSPKAQP